MFVITRKSDKNKNLTLFLVNRNFIKDHWWSSYLETAIIFKNKAATQKICNKLIYGNCKVVTLEEAIIINEENIRIKEKIEITTEVERGRDPHKDY